MKNRVGFVFLLAPLALSPPAIAGTITVFTSPDPEKIHEPVPVEISEADYRASLKKIITTVQASTLSKLATSAHTARQEWLLRGVGVGLSISLSAGAGPWIQLGGTCSMKLIFSNSSSGAEP